MQVIKGVFCCVWSIRISSVLLTTDLLKAVILSARKYIPHLHVYPTAFLENIWHHVKGTAQKIARVRVHRLNQV